MKLDPVEVEILRNRLTAVAEEMGITLNRPEVLNAIDDDLPATLFDGISRHSPEGLAFKARVEAVGWKQAVRECDSGPYDWTRNEPTR